MRYGSLEGEVVMDMSGLGRFIFCRREGFEKLREFGKVRCLRRRVA